jgi:SAM-dependent methyltransferase
MMKNFYDNKFYERLRYKSKESAIQIVPIIIKLISPRSVVDVGCGVGTWLSVFQEKGVEDIFGIDGDYVNESSMEIPADFFQSCNLEEAEPDSFTQRKFDLAICLEVAEHINSSKSKKLVTLLTSLAPVVVFSAAIPFQGGVNHVNEQWPTYWRDLFFENGYVVVDCIRKRVWNNPKVKAHYAQNIFVYVQEKQMSKYPFLCKEMNSNTVSFPLSIVHPSVFCQKVDSMRPENIYLKKYLRDLPYVILGFIERKQKKIKYKFQSKIH